MTYKIGITHCVHQSIFGSSKGQTGIILANICIQLGYDVTLVCQTEKTWWDDCSTLSSKYKIVPYMCCSGLDLLIDIDGTMSSVIRNQIASKVIIFIRKALLFNELENATYIQLNPVRNTDGISAVWVWDAFNSEIDFDCIRVLFPCPIIRVPFVWIPDFLLSYKELSGKTIEYPKLDNSCEWKIHIGEKNSDNTSSAIFPLVITYQLHIENIIRFTEYSVHNSSKIKDNAFFKSNILENINIKGVKLEMLDRERYYDWVDEINPFVITHSRFVPFHPGLLDLAWIGIPFLHNSPVLRNMGEGLDEMYYTESSILGACSSVRWFTENVCKWTCHNESRRAIIEKTWSIEKNIDVWKNIICNVFCENPEVAGAASKNPELKIGFTDMWEGFLPESNFFIEMMRHYYPSYSIVGVDGTSKQTPVINILIFGPFGSNWKLVPNNIPKIFFNGENTPPPESTLNNTISLYLTFSRKEDTTHIRFPLWYLFVKWFDNIKEIDTINQSNPIGLPEYLTTTPHTIMFKDRPDFCAFVVSNPCNGIRNKTFEILDRYKSVNSGGQLYNNIGSPLASKYGGGGAGDISKYHFFTKHKFVLCFENSANEGYVTEKLLHAKMAGCVPLYWGDSNAWLDFDPTGFVNLSNITNPEDILLTIQDYETNSSKYEQIASVPPLDNNRLESVKNNIHRVAEQIYKLSTTVSEKIIPSPCFVSFVTNMFLKSAEINIKALERHKNAIPKLKYIIFTGADITTEKKTALSIKYPWIELRTVPSISPNPDFPDFWETHHFGWKLWILNNMCNDEHLYGCPIIYTDIGAQWLKLPHEFILSGYDNGVCVMKDSENINKYWCSESMIQEMSVTTEELSSHQILAGFISFQAGHPTAVHFFKEALQWGLKKSVICGRRLLGILPCGQNYGHRHDQSILSILSIRNNISSVIGQNYICEESVRKTSLTDKYIYLHRGEFMIHNLILPKIDDIWMVSLDRRKDRWDSWCKEYPQIAKYTNKFSAIDGKKIELTQELFSLFEKNDFIWKKSVSGCALSHMMLWFQLLMESPTVNSYLIMEDDVRFQPKFWEEEWCKIAENIPQDAELLYLGGVLPSNRPMYTECISPVNTYWSVIKPNQCFSRSVPMPIFHFCAYSYILTKKGAEKLISVLSKNGCNTSIDHLLGWPGHSLNKYVMTYPATTCFQESDITYQKSDFDNFKRIDTFDSDIWNNADVFNTSLFKNNICIPDLWSIFNNILKTHPKNKITEKLMNRQYYEQYLQSYSSTSKSEISVRNPDLHINPVSCAIYYYGESAKCDIRDKEIDWLRTFLPNIIVQKIQDPTELLDSPWFLICHPHIGFWRKVFNRYATADKPFSIIHLSDEHDRDATDFYELPQCKHVIRNYIREGLIHPKIVTIPLGTYRRSGNAQKAFSNRDLIWSFHGTNWFNREYQIEPLKKLVPNNYHFTSGWLSPEMSDENKYCDILSNSKFCPILRGNHFETYRLYEALELGTIPLYIRTRGDAVYWKWISEHLGLLEIKTWDAAYKTVEFFIKCPEHGEQYRTGIMKKWTEWKNNIGVEVSKMISI